MAMVASAPARIDEFQLAEMAQAAIEVRSEIVERLIKEWRMLQGEYALYSRKRWFKLLVMQAIAKEQGLPDMGL